MWSHENFSMWVENLPKQVNDTSHQLAAADTKIDKLGQDARKALWETDQVKLARDLAILGRLHNDVMKTDRSRRLGKIAHLRQQNVVGAGLVTNFMDEMCSFITGVERDLESALNKAWVPEMFGFKGSPLS